MRIENTEYLSGYDVKKCFGEGQVEQNNDIFSGCL